MTSRRTTSKSNSGRHATSSHLRPIVLHRRLSPSHRHPAPPITAHHCPIASFSPSRHPRHRLSRLALLGHVSRVLGSSSHAHLQHATSLTQNVFNTPYLCGTAQKPPALNDVETLREWKLSGNGSSPGMEALREKSAAHWEWGPRRCYNGGPWFLRWNLFSIRFLAPSIFWRHAHNLRR
jgi:hypothetical protein